MKNAILKIDLDALLYNFRHLKCFYKKDIIAVIKDNAYSLGIVEIAKTLKNESNVIFAVSSIQEIIKLRENGIDNTILYLNVFDNDDLDLLEKYNVTVIVQSSYQLNLIKNRKLDFHIKINSGMNRLGLYDYEINDVIDKINKSYLNKLKGIMTHFADEDKDNTSYSFFEKIVKKIKKDNLIVHCHSSSSLKDYNQNIATHIRVGIKLYGIGERSMFLQNVVFVSCPILEIKKIKGGKYVGYNKTFITPCNGYLYILPIGYGNGFGDFKTSFAYTENTYLKQAGKISMDYSSYFSTKLFDKDSILELIGNHISIEQLSSINNIKPHELLIRLKLPIEYIKKKI